MTIAYSSASSYGVSWDAATATDLYVSTSTVTTIVSTIITGTLAAGSTVELQITDGSNNIIGYLTPPGFPVAYNQSYSITDKVTLQSGYKIRIKDSVASTTGNVVIFMSIITGL